MGKSIIIIGRGHSVTKCTKEFVDSHDEVAIINHIVYDGYEDLVSDHADYMFGNRTSFRYLPAMVTKLGLKEIIFTGHDYQRFDMNNPNVISRYPSPNLHNEMLDKYKLLPSSGMQGLYYLLKQKKYNKISIVGFDFYELNSIPYYFKPSEVHQTQKYLWSGTYKHNKINVPSGHDTDKSIELFERFLKENLDVEFNIISHSKRVNSIENNNVKIINI